MTTPKLYVIDYFPSGGFVFVGKIPVLRAMIRGILRTAPLVDCAFTSDKVKKSFLIWISGHKKMYELLRR